MDHHDILLQRLELSVGIAVTSSWTGPVVPLYIVGHNLSATEVRDRRPSLWFAVFLNSRIGAAWVQFCSFQWRRNEINIAGALNGRNSKPNELNQGPGFLGEGLTAIPPLTTCSYSIAL